MSTGMRQKLAIAVVLATDVPLVILDEPTANLDPSARAEVLRLVQESRSAGKTVIFSSHVLSEVEEICDRVAILRSGKVAHEESMRSLRRGHLIRARLAGAFAGIPAALATRVAVAECAAGRIVLEASDSLGPLLGWLATLPLDEVQVEPVGLAAVYDRVHR
jgi:ABC-2 type transport system ATP-binding protein